MTATERRLFDLFNNAPWETEALQIDIATETLIARGMKRSDAAIVAAEAYAQWNGATKSWGAG